MHNDDMFSYSLTVTGSPESQEKVFQLLQSEPDVLDAYLYTSGPPDAPYHTYKTPEEYLVPKNGWSEYDIERTLHSIAIQVPEATLEIHGEDYDDPSFAFTKGFKADLFQEVRMSTYMPSLSDFGYVPFHSRNELPKELSTQSQALALYEQMRNVFNQNNAAYYIAKNLAYLAQNAEPDRDLPLEKLYALAARLEQVSGSLYLPCLNEERLDALRDMLENGFRDEYGACLGNLAPEQVPDFLLTCNKEAFLFAVESTVISNQDKYSADYNDRTFYEDKTIFASELDSFIDSSAREKALASLLQDAEQRQHLEQDTGRGGAPHPSLSRDED